MDSRRRFLTGLATLPLIGGSVALIGQPTAAAVAIDARLLRGYERWLDLERSFLRYEMYGPSHRAGPFAARYEAVFRDRQTGQVWDISAVTCLDFDHASPMPSERAAIILSAAGVPLS